MIAPMRLSSRGGLIMQITFRSIDDIRPYKENPRVNDAAVDSVARSLKEFGWRQPVVVDGDGVIIVGHTRWKAARQLGMELVPVHVAEGLTPEQARANRIADNQTANIATWDFELLPVELAELEDLGLDLSILGIDGKPLDHARAVRNSRLRSPRGDRPQLPASSPRRDARPPHPPIRSIAGSASPTPPAASEPRKGWLIRA
jgi:ParB-like chromosome segregation protein Spo0J